MSPEDRIATESACRQLVLRFMALNDRQEWQRMCELLTEDATFVRPTDPEHPLTGRVNIRAAFEARPAARITRHLCTNIIITARSSSRASGTMYALLFTGAIENRGDIGIVADERQLVGEFEHDFVHTEDGWRIARHCGKIVFSTT